MDEVRPFPALLVPSVSISKKQRNTSRKKLSSNENTNQVDVLPGILKSNKSQIHKESGESNTFVGFNASNIKMDKIAPVAKTNEPHVIPFATLNVVDIINQVATTGVKPSTKKVQKVDIALSELRSYTSMMDQYSLHNFMIWNGEVLRNTPEFQSFKRTHEKEWSYINVVIGKLESLMSDSGVKLAIISGLKLAEIAMLNLSNYHNTELLECCANADQIKPFLSGLSANAKNHLVVATIKIQTLARRWIALHRYKCMINKLSASIKLQSVMRRYIIRCRAIKRQNEMRKHVDTRWRSNISKLKLMWTHKSCRRLIIHIPSISASEYERLCMPNICPIQNAHLSCLHQLLDPNVEMVYICAKTMSSSDLAYIDKFLSLLNISVVPRRLKFLVPEMAAVLPTHIPLAHLLWYSSTTLRKIKAMISNHTDVVVIPSDLGWAERRIADFLKVPIMAPDPLVAGDLSIRSQSKRLFMEACVNIPIGAHDIFNEEDFFVAMSRLMSSNLDINRWIVKLNTDFHNQSCAYIDVNQLSIIASIRGEQTALLKTSNDPKVWFEKTVQLHARKRIMKELQLRIGAVIKICRPDIFSDWPTYLTFLKKIGCVIEAEPLAMRGQLQSNLFIDPSGEMHVMKGTYAVCDSHYQVQSKIYPQTVVHDSSLEGASRAMGKLLYSRFGVVGYITLSYTAFYDSFEGTPRLWATDLHLGMDSTFGALGTLAILVRNTEISSRLAHPLLPMIPEGQHYFPPPPLGCILVVVHRLHSHTHSYVNVHLLSRLLAYCRPILRVRPHRGAPPPHVQQG